MANSIVALTDTASQIAELQRRQKLAEALSAQGAAPIEVQSYKGIQAPISPLSGIAKVLQTYLGAKQAADAVKGEKEARQTAREESQTALKQYYGNPEFSKFENPMSAQEAAVPALTPVAPPETIQMGGVPTNVKGNVTPVVSAQGPTTYNNAQYVEPQATQGRETTPQERMAMALQFQGSGNPMLEQMAPALYGEAKGEAKSAKVFDAIGKANQAGADPAIMNAFKAAGDPSGAVSYLGSIGLKREEAQAAAAAYQIKAADTAEQRELDRIARADDREAQRNLTFQIAQMSNQTRRDLAAAIQAGAPKTTQSEQQSGFLANRILNSAKLISDITKKDPNAANVGLLEAAGGSIPFVGESTQKLAQSGNRQAISSAQDEIIDAALVLATGAAYTKEQMKQKRDFYKPNITDKPEIKAIKQERIKSLIQDAKVRAGPTWTPQMDQAVSGLFQPIAAPATNGRKNSNVTVSNF